jgi:GMP synthase (glutamine-hydrolysing)
MKPVTVLVIQHVEPEPPSRIAVAIERAGAKLQIVRIDRGEAVPASLEGHAGLVVMGGPMGVYEADRFPHLEIERTLIASAIAQRIPVIGICLGSQLLASVLGATVKPGPRKEIGWHSVSLEAAAADDPLFGAAPRVFTALHWHGDVFDLPPAAVGLARSQLTQHQAFSFDGIAWGILFHLEVTSRQLAEMTTAFADELAAEAIPPREILQGWFSHGATLESLAETVFGAWMAKVQARHAQASVPQIA